MDAFEIGEGLERRRRSRDAYHEFVRVPALSVGVYGLPAGGIDPQGPHAEEEVYVVVRGEGRLRVDEEDRPVREGSLVFVPAGVAHRFHSITRDLEVLVVFAPAEGSRGAAVGRRGRPARRRSRPR